MSYHILHQFDAPWFAEDARPGETRPGGPFNSLLDEGGQRSDSRRASRRCGLWLIAIASLLVAASALFFAIDARSRADDLQRRLATLESRK